MNASVHHLTPVMSVIGPRGEAVRQIEYLRTVAGEAVRALISRLQHDAAGHLIAQRDPRLATPNTTTLHRLDGTALKTRNVDGGENTALPGLAGELLQGWDTNGNHREMSYDPQLRLRSVTENGVTGFETFSYETASADPTHNLRGQMTALSDPSGTVQFNSFNMRDQSTQEIRTFEDGKICAGRQRFSAIGALLQATDAGGHIQHSTFDIAGQLAQVQLQLSGQSVQPILNGADYNAAGQITEQRLGNGVTSHWHYREADGRLLRQYAQKASEPAIQDFEYEYDAAGNVTRIIDHTYTPTFFRNQRVDGERTFGYDSVYRLTRATGYSDAPPTDNPGRPQPTDPKDRRNYVESFEYDDGNNLKKLTHVRDGNTYTREMFIDPASNRGVRWKAGDPAPDFSALFDRAGNLLALQPGQPMNWTSRNHLESLIFVDHASGPPDQERYHYSQGARVYKRNETHASTVSHIAEVHYVGSLEVRTKSSGEELHRITVATGVGEVMCLHWVAGKPPGIDADQVCYSHSDHLGSSVTQIDQRAQVISRESYYAFGNTATMAARSQIEADYKFIRYSGKEMDVTGLYYYGARYYAPWLCRWVSADPVEDADGLNRYVFVGNNPMTYVDTNGQTRTPAELKRQADYSVNFLSAANRQMDILERQIDNLSSRSRFRTVITAKFVVQVAKVLASWFSTNDLFSAVETLAGGDPYSSMIGELKGLTIGNFTAERSAELVDMAFSNFQDVSNPLIPRKIDISAESISQQARGVESGPLDAFMHVRSFEPKDAIEASVNAISATGGSQLYGVGELIELAKVAEQGIRAEEGMFSQEIEAHLNALDALREKIVRVSNAGQIAFSELKVIEFYNSDVDHLLDLGQGRVGTQQARTVRLDNLHALTEKALYVVDDRKQMLKTYGRQTAYKQRNK
ncbi:RHS repeat domain-containing protein [Pseudomonas sp. MWU12-2029]|uniref:RHS repeat domain-containing protein n=1 Tax=Pseudomonas sp. MWU12-2029 TaxID=2927805 RepID=UPI00200E2315|nr:RHS repeat-associated core domain-containing protein [Pseudomonas sp. MWU12-2029]